MLLIWPPWTRKYLHHWLEHEVERETCDIAVANYIQVQEVTCISWYWGLSAGWWGSGRGISSTASLCRPEHGTDEAGCRYRYGGPPLCRLCWVWARSGPPPWCSAPAAARSSPPRSPPRTGAGCSLAQRSFTQTCKRCLTIFTLSIFGESAYNALSSFFVQIVSTGNWDSLSVKPSTNGHLVPKDKYLKPCFQRNFRTSNFRWRQLVSRHSPTDNIAVRIT